MSSGIMAILRTVRKKAMAVFTMSESGMIVLRSITPLLFTKGSGGMTCPTPTKSFSTKCFTRTKSISKGGSNGRKMILCTGSVSCIIWDSRFCSGGSIRRRIWPVSLQAVGICSWSRSRNRQWGCFNSKVWFLFLGLWKKLCLLLLGKYGKI